MFDDELLNWVDALTGFHSDRIRSAIRRVASWSVPLVEAEFLRRPSIDTAVAVMQLSEAADELLKAGVPEDRLVTKIRRAGNDVWPVWAELRAGALLARVLGPDIAIQLEPDRKAGKHPDFRIETPNLGLMNVEFKAVSLSDKEAQFSRRMSSALEELIPPRGLLTLHAALNVSGVNASPDQIRIMHQEARTVADRMPHYPLGLAGVTIVGHGGESNYARRLIRRLCDEAAIQVPSDGRSWGAFYWTNGSPLTAALIDQVRQSLPQHMAGVILLGDAVVFPVPLIHSFTFILPRSESSDGPTLWRSDVSAQFARDVAEGFERSSGVRSVLLADTRGATVRELLRRDGSRRILPFNLLMDVDPDDPIIPKADSRRR